MQKETLREILIYKALVPIGILWHNYVTSVQYKQKNKEQHLVTVLLFIWICAKTVHSNTCINDSSLSFVHFSKVGAK
jgi:hypothetical protein